MKTKRARNPSMNSPSEPRLNKLPFIVTDLACLLAVLLIGLYAKDPFAPLPFVSAVLLVILGGVALLVPYVTDYAADSTEASRRLHDELELQIKRAQAAGEGLARAAAQIKAIEEAVHKSARDAETLPYRMQEKLAEFNEALAAKESDDREALEQELEELRAANSDQLKAVADKIGKAAADWSALEVATRKQLAGAEAALAKLHAGAGDTATKVEAAVARIDDALAAALKQLDQRLSDLAKAATPAPAHAEPAPHRREEPAKGESHHSPSHALPAAVTAEPEVAAAEPAPAAAAVPTPETVPAAGETAPAEEAPKPKKPRAPRKPKAEDTLAAMSTEAPAASAEPVPEPVAESTPSPSSDEPSSGGAAAVEASTSSDGATRLLATAYIGIGNKLFIRGDGPGLSWDQGVPMQFVSIGKWGWSTQEAAGPVRVKLYKNDEVAALSGEITLEPSRHTEVTALF
jgi:hypothetical protein